MARIDPHLAIGGLAARELDAERGAVKGSGCPDPEHLAAYVDDGLTDHQRDDIEAHLAECASCRKMVAGMAPVDEPRAVPATVLRPVFRVDWKWLSMAAMVVLAVGLWYAVQPARPVEAPGAPETRPPVAETAPPPPDVDPSRLAASPPPQPPPGRADGSRTEPSRPDPQGGTQQESRRAAAAPSPVPASPSAEAGRAPVGQSAGGERTPAAKELEEARIRQAARIADEATRATPVPPPAAPPATPPAQAPSRIEERIARPAAQPTANDAAASPGAPRSELALKAAAPAGLTFGDPERRMLWRIVRGTRLESSSDGGATWTERHRERSARLVAGTAPSLDVAWVAGARGTVLRFVVPGGWARVSKPTEEAIVAIDASSAQVARVTTAAGLRHETRDGGATWTPVP